MRLLCVKGRTCADGTAWNLEGSEEDYSFLLKGSANEADMTPKQRSHFAEQALALLAGSDRYCKVEDIQRELGCFERHAYRVLKGLYVEDKISSQTLASTGVRPKYVYAEKTFCTSPHTSSSSDKVLDRVFPLAKQIETNFGWFGLERQ